MGRASRVSSQSTFTGCPLSLWTLCASLRDSGQLEWPRASESLTDPESAGSTGRCPTYTADPCESKVEAVQSTKACPTKRNYPRLATPGGEQDTGLKSPWPAKNAKTTQMNSKTSTVHGSAREQLRFLININQPSTACDSSVT